MLLHCSLRVVKCIQENRGTNGDAQQVSSRRYISEKEGDGLVLQQEIGSWGAEEASLFPHSHKLARHENLMLAFCFVVCRGLRVLPSRAARMLFSHWVFRYTGWLRSTQPWFLHGRAMPHRWCFNMGHFSPVRPWFALFWYFFWQ